MLIILKYEFLSFLQMTLGMRPLRGSRGGLLVRALNFTCMGKKSNAAHNDYIHVTLHSHWSYLKDKRPFSVHIQDSHVGVSCSFHGAFDVITNNLTHTDSETSNTYNIVNCQVEADMFQPTGPANEMTKALLFVLQNSHKMVVWDTFP